MLLYLLPDSVKSSQVMKKSRTETYKEYISCYDLFDCFSLPNDGYLAETGSKYKNTFITYQIYLLIL